MQFKLIYSAKENLSEEDILEQEHETIQFESNIELADLDLLLNLTKAFLFDHDCRAGCSWALFYLRKGGDWNVLFTSDLFKRKDE